MAWWIKKNLICTEQPSLLDIVWPEPSFKIFDTRHLSKKKKKKKKKWIFFSSFLKRQFFEKLWPFPPAIAISSDRLHAAHKLKSAAAQGAASGHLQ